jgi:hypothetical protein
MKMKEGRKEDQGSKVQRKYGSKEVRFKGSKVQRGRK